MKIFTNLLILLLAGISYAQDSTSFYILKYSTPSSVINIFSEKKLDSLYSFSYHLNPFYLRGDFNGDEDNDIAIPIKEKARDKIGFAIIHSSTKNVFIIGAGQVFNSIDDFKEFNIWSVATDSIYKSHWEKKSLKLKHESINIGVFECTSGLIYWDGKEYKWYQMAD